MERGFSGFCSFSCFKLWILFEITYFEGFLLFLLYLGDEKMRENGKEIWICESCGFSIFVRRNENFNLLGEIFMFERTEQSNYKFFILLFFFQNMQIGVLKAQVRLLDKWRSRSYWDLKFWSFECFGLKRRELLLTWLQNCAWFWFWGGKSE